MFWAHLKRREEELGNCLVSGFGKKADRGI
jgi:hypothetical protein